MDVSDNGTPKSPNMVHYYTIYTCTCHLCVVSPNSLIYPTIEYRFMMIYAFSPYRNHVIKKKNKNMSSKRSPHRNFLGTTQPVRPSSAGRRRRLPEKGPTRLQTMRFCRFCMRFCGLWIFHGFLFNHLEVQMLVCYCMLVSPVKK